MLQVFKIERNKSFNDVLPALDEHLSISLSGVPYEIVPSRGDATRGLILIYKIKKNIPHDAFWKDMICKIQDFETLNQRLELVVGLKTNHSAGNSIETDTN